MLLSSVLFTSIQTLASSPFWIAVFSSGLKILAASKSSDFELSRLADSIGAASDTSASFSNVPVPGSSVLPSAGIVLTFLPPQPLVQKVSSFPSSVAVASFLTIHAPDQS